MIQGDELPGFLFDLFLCVGSFLSEGQIDSGSQVLTCVCAPIDRTCLYVLPTNTTIFSGFELPDFRDVSRKSVCVLPS